MTLYSSSSLRFPNPSLAMLDHQEMVHLFQTVNPRRAGLQPPQVPLSLSTGPGIGEEINSKFFCID